MDNIKENVLYLYTDGGCRGNQSNSNIGSYAYVLLFNDMYLEGFEKERNTTNNKMEIKAVILGLKQLKRFDIPVVVRSDSAYVVNCMQKKWYEGWINRGWRKSDKKPVENKDLWVELLKEVKKFDNITFEKVKGHDVNKFNNRCDFLVNFAMDQM